MDRSIKPGSGKRIENYQHFPRAPWRLWKHNYKTRRHLHDLLCKDPDILHLDLGLSAEAALKEIKKPFWRK